MSMPEKPTVKDLPDLSHLINLTDDTGVIQHAKFVIPDPKFGYSTDDNARALIVVLKHFQESGDELDLKLARIYLSFLRYAQDENGKFFVSLNYQRVWLGSADLGDVFGRAMWSLGFTAFSGTTLASSAKWLFGASRKYLNSLPSLRSKAFSVLGLDYCLSAAQEQGDTNWRLKPRLQKMADDLVVSYQKNAGENWAWFEDRITYENARLPQALLVAFRILGKPEYKKVGLNTLDFLISTTFNQKRGFFDFVGQREWFLKGKEKALFDQQPVEAGSTIEACVEAYRLTKEKKYLDWARLAFDWFFGKNRLSQKLYDSKTRGIKDGLTPKGPNENQGAESVLSFLLAWFALRELE